MFKNLSPNGRGMLAITGASIIFVFSDALAKIATRSWPVAQYLTVRGVFAIAIAAALVVANGEVRNIGKIRHPLIIARSMLEAIVALCFITALSMMPLADLTSLLMLSPLVITVLAVLMFSEVVGWRRWSAIFAGFIGMVLVVQPGGAASAAPNYMFAVSLGLLSVLGVAARDIVTRRLNSDVPNVVVMLATSVGSCSAGLILSPIVPWQAFEWQPFLIAAGTSIMLTMGNFCMIIGCRGVDLSVVAPYRYSAVIWSISLGALVFGDLPNMLSIIGMCIIVASGIYTLHRERVRQREAHARSAKTG